MAGARPLLHPWSLRCLAFPRHRPLPWHSDASPFSRHWESHFRAEIDIPEINADEAASLKPSIALPAAFRAAGLEYNPALTGVQISLQRRADGRAYIRLVSDRVVSEPFVDLILQASWASGRIVRDYTILLDPPALRARAPAAPTAPQVAATTPVTPPARVTATPTPAAPAAAARCSRPGPCKHCCGTPPRREQAASPCSVATPPARLHVPTSRPRSRWTRCWSHCCAPTRMHSSTAT